LLTEWHSADARDDRHEINRARQAAEDLFKPRQQTPDPDVLASGPNGVSPVEHQPRRQPRIFMVQPPRPMAEARVEAPQEPKASPRRAAMRRKPRRIPASQLGRVRALTSYGMTQAQVAELYGVTVGEIQRIVGPSD
jgi:hypothetical protein